MPLLSCPHYPPPNATNETYICRGCGTEMANPASLAAQQRGLIHGTAGARVINAHNSNPSRRTDK